MPADNTFSSQYIDNIVVINTYTHTHTQTIIAVTNEYNIYGQ